MQPCSHRFTTTATRCKKAESNKRIERNSLGPRRATFFSDISTLPTLFGFLPRNPSQAEDEAQTYHPHQQVEVLSRPDAEPVGVVVTKIVRKQPEQAIPEHEVSQKKSRRTMWISSHVKQNGNDR